MKLILKQKNYVKKKLCKLLKINSLIKIPLQFPILGVSNSFPLFNDFM